MIVTASAHFGGMSKVEGKSLEQGKEDGAGAERAGAGEIRNVHVRVQPNATHKGSRNNTMAALTKSCRLSVNVSLHLLKTLLELVGVLSVSVLCLSDLATAN